MKSKKIELEICFDDELFNDIAFEKLDKSIKKLGLSNVIKSYLEKSFCYDVDNITLDADYKISNINISSNEYENDHYTNIFCVIIKNSNEWEEIEDLLVENYIDKIRSVKKQ